MLVKERMSPPFFSVKPDIPFMECLKLMQEKGIHRTPVLDKKGKLVGIISDIDLLKAAPSDATTLSIWEMNDLLDRIQVKDLMTKNVLTVSENTPIEDAVNTMVKNDISEIPVMRGDKVVGLITHTDLFKILQEFMGAQDKGVHVTALVPDKPDELDILIHTISESGGSFVAFGQFAGDTPENKLVSFKVSGLAAAELEDKIKPYVEKFVDIRTCC